MMCSGFKILKPSVIIALHSLIKHRHWLETFCFLQSVEGMKVICHELTQAADPESTMLEDLIKEADRLASCLAVMVSLCCAIHVTFSLFIFMEYILHSPISCFHHEFLDVPMTFNFSLSGASSRSCKYLLNTLMQVC